MHFFFKFREAKGICEKELSEAKDTFSKLAALEKFAKSLGVKLEDVCHDG